MSTNRPSGPRLREPRLAVVPPHDPENLEFVLEQSIAAEKARKADAARWLEDVVACIGVETKALAAATKAGGDFPDVAKLFVVLAAHRRLLLAHQEFFKLTQGGK